MLIRLDHLLQRRGSVLALVCRCTCPGPHTHLSSRLSRWCFRVVNPSI